STGRTPSTASSSPARFTARASTPWPSRSLGRGSLSSSSQFQGSPAQEAQYTEYRVLGLNRIYLFGYYRILSTIPYFLASSADIKKSRSTSFSIWDSALPVFLARSLFKVSLVLSMCLADISISEA
ncbi:MAG: hypothetical protein QG551_483, partial [Patescibacteria group bacterium]|nr:hypothetical protein [Patescibacteria group bacterium]